MTDMQMSDRMGDEVTYIAHCINGASYPTTTPITVKIGQRVRLRILNANFTETRYIRLAGHPLTVTHADGSLRVLTTCTNIARATCSSSLDRPEKQARQRSLLGARRRPALALSLSRRGSSLLRRSKLSRSNA